MAGVGTYTVNVLATL